MARKVSVDGVARTIIKSVREDHDDRIVMARYSKVCGLLRDPERTNEAFQALGKGHILKRARQGQRTHT